MAGQRVGLIIANSEYADPTLRRLPAADAELEALTEALSRAEIGNFKLEILANQPCHAIQDALEKFLRARTPEDFVLVYLVGHGVRNDRGQLFFTTADTRREQLVSTALGAVHFANELRQCRASRKILLLDCCFVSAPASGAGVPLEDEWRGSYDFRVRESVQAILSGSDAIQYEWEGEELRNCGAKPSRFTHLLISGMQTGKADLNQDGWISVSEMENYIVRESHGLDSALIPRTWVSGPVQEMILATAPREAHSTLLPEELGSLVESESAAVRLAVIDELEALTSDSESSLAGAARQALERLAHDASQRVAEKAKQTLASPLADRRKLKDPSATECALLDPFATRAPAFETLITVPEASQNQTSGDETTSPRDENVQFTAYRPASVIASRWYRLLVFTHVDDRLDETEPGELSSSEQMEEQAKQMLGPDFPSYRETGSESRYRIPREGEITFVPSVRGVEFHPARQSFLWIQGLKVHPETFSFRTRPELTETIARGWISVFFGHLVLAEISLNLRIVRDEPVSSRTHRARWERASVSPFRKVFVSYSHADANIVEATERYVRTLGDEYLRDAANLRSGERWDERLFRFIDQADLFQLFWSVNAARSAFVEREWRYAVSLPREAFIRPTYWEEPMPEPPAPLKGIHFSRLPFIQSAPAVPISPPATVSRNLNASLEGFETQADALPATPPERPQAEVVAPRASIPRAASRRTGPLPRLLAIVGFSFVLLLGICVLELRLANRVASPSAIPQPVSTTPLLGTTPSISPSATPRPTPSVRGTTP